MAAADTNPSRDRKGAVAFSEWAPPLAGARGSDSFRL
jgi:hypothetical protein